MGCYSRFFEFYGGEDKTLSIQVNIENTASSCKEPMDLTGASDIEVELPASPDNIILDLLSTPPVVVDNAMLGKIHVDLTNVQTDQMITGPIIVRVTKSGKKTTAVAAGAKRLEILSC